MAQFDLIFYFNILSCTVGIIGTAFIFVLMFNNGHCLRSAKIFPFILTLTICDGIYILCKFFSTIFDNTHFVTVFTATTHTSAILCTTLLSMDMFVCVFCPFAYERKVRQYYYWICSAIAMFISLVYGISTMFVHVWPTDTSAHNETLSQAAWPLYASAIILHIIPLIVSAVCAVCVLHIVHETQRLLLSQTVSIGDHRLTEAHRRRFQRALCRAILFVTVKVFVMVALLLPWWTLAPFTNIVHSNFEYVLLLSACLDPYITILTQRLYKRETQKLLHNCNVYTHVAKVMKKCSSALTLTDRLHRNLSINSDNVCMLAYRLNVVQTTALTFVAPVNVASSKLDLSKVERSSNEIFADSRSCVSLNNDFVTVQSE
jgi:hypothetical protein